MAHNPDGSDEPKFTTGATTVRGFQSLALAVFTGYGLLFVRSMASNFALRHLCDLLLLWQT